MNQAEDKQSFLYVTVISGFLGAGKTTLLNQLLSNKGERKLAVLVNDLGKVNIDASQIEKTVTGLTGAISGMVELNSGCICCSIQSELMDALHELIVDHQPDEIVIEATGAAEPRQLLENIYSYNLYRANFGSYIEVRNAVTVVSAFALQKLLEDYRAAKQKTKRLLTVDPRRPVSELQFAQIECSDYILLNKVDLVPEEKKEQLKKYLSGLNPRAEIEESQFAEIDVENIISKTRFDKKKSLLSASWQNELSLNRQSKFVFSQEEDGLSRVFKNTTTHADYGISSFVYNARLPFNESKFLTYLRKGIPGLLRAKGYYWTTNNPDLVGFLSICGEIHRMDYEAPWWNTRIKQGEIEKADLPNNVKSIWEDPTGDCRQEIVFIGIDLDESEIVAELDQCLEQS